jgi:hypothetical protein
MELQKPVNRQRQGNGTAYQAAAGNIISSYREFVKDYENKYRSNEWSNPVPRIPLRNLHERINREGNAKKSHYKTN